MLPSIFGENLFDEFFDDPFNNMIPAFPRDPRQGKRTKSLMKTDVRELDNGYEIDMDLPGFKKEDVQVKLEDGYLTVSATQSSHSEEKKEGRYIRQERYCGQCSRSFYVGDGVRAENVSAKFEDGILKLSLPKAVQRELPVSTINIE